MGSDKKRLHLRLFAGDQVFQIVPTNDLAPPDDDRGVAECDAGMGAFAPTKTISGPLPHIALSSQRGKIVEPLSDAVGQSETL